jgi:hypothetical protein
MHDTSADTRVYREWSSQKDLPSSLAFRCIDCRTWGALNATVTFPEGLGDVLDDLKDLNPLNDINIEMAFNDVGVFFNLGVDASLAGTVKIPLFTSQSPVAIAVSGYLDLDTARS